MSLVRGTSVARVEAFEAFVAVALEAENFVVSEAVKFPVKRQTAKAAYPEFQTHGYEVDLVAARADRLVLATVKSFFGSGGVVADHVRGTTADRSKARMYALLNDPVIRDAVVTGAAKRYGYHESQVQLRLYVGKFAAPKTGRHEDEIRTWAAGTIVGAGPIEVHGVRHVVEVVRGAASHKHYRDNPVIVTMKVLQAAGVLTLKLPEDIGD